MAPRHPNQRELVSLPAELRRTTVPQVVRDWVRRTTGKSVERWRRLPGASSSAVHALTLSDGDVAVLRRWVWPRVLQDEPVIVRRELDALAVAGRAGLPAPAIIAADPGGVEIGDGVPALLMTRCPGQALEQPDLQRLAELAAAIHDVDAPDFAHDFFVWCEDALTEPPPTAVDVAMWREAIRLRATAMPEFRPTFIHRDFHPGNVLWRYRSVSGIVDWALACRGPWECDVATCRSNLEGLAGIAAADEFLQRYEATTRRTFNHYWDLNYFLENEADHWTPVEVQRAEPFLRTIMRKLT